MPRSWFSCCLGDVCSAGVGVCGPADHDWRVGGSLIVLGVAWRAATVAMAVIADGGLCVELVLMSVWSGCLDLGGRVLA